MTKVQIRFRLSRPLDEPLLERVASAHAVYGFSRIVPYGDELLVDYDASRLTAPDVEAALLRAGLPVTR
jgi:hypothetical protein